MGFDLAATSHRETDDDGKRGAFSGAPPADDGVAGELAEVVGRWHALTPAQRRAVMGVIRDGRT